MKKLWVIGDSFTKLTGIEDEYIENYSKKYPTFNIESDGRDWPTLLSNKLGYELNLTSFPGGSNSMIIKHILLTLQHISKDDILIVGWTRPTRFDIPVMNEIGNFATITNANAAEHVDLKYDLNGALISYFEHVYIPHMDDYVKDGINTIINFSNFLNKTYKFKSYNWWDIPHESIRQEFPSMHDSHPSLKGHQQLFNAIDKMEYGTISNWDSYHMYHSKNLD